MAGFREVTLRPQLAQVRHHKAASSHSLPGDYVFATLAGGPLAYRNVERRAMDAAYAAAVKAKQIPAGRPKPVMHDARHTFGSMLIREGEDVYSVSRQMGHANVSTTLNVYTGEYDRARDPSKPKPDYGNVLETAASFQALARPAGNRIATRSRQLGETGRKACADFASRRSPVRSRYAPLGSSCIWLSSTGGPHPSGSS